MATTLLTTSQGMDNTTTDTSSPSSTWCDDRGVMDPSCLIARADMLDDVDVEFMMDSEISRRILAGHSVCFTGKTPNRGQAASFDRKGFPPCHPDSNRNRPPLHHRGVIRCAFIAHATAISELTPKHDVVSSISSACSCFFFFCKCNKFLCTHVMENRLCY
ncbi:uncharacterized protein LOC126627156 [Malus sylvestris]|uniref:uncharacterized protein LOC126627156 n=1 Tax=Malus sylvestris TaxID=3752 RepID=UPI0021AD135A|nr:uncharacterized protein LOC126627156 [Malus sylvestris]